jgi:hypothetical protein
MSAVKNSQGQISIVFGAIFLLFGSLVVSIALTYAEPSDDFEESAYDVGIEKIEDNFVYGKFKGQLGIQFAVVLQSNVDIPKAKSSLTMSCEAVSKSGEKLYFGEIEKKFSIKIAGTQTRKFFFPLNAAGAKFVRRMPSDKGIFSCSFQLPDYITVKKDFFDDSQPENDAVEFDVYWAEKTLKVDNFRWSAP